LPSNLSDFVTFGLRNFRAAKDSPGDPVGSRRRVVKSGSGVVGESCVGSQSRRRVGGSRSYSPKSRESLKKRSGESKSCLFFDSIVGDCLES